jgi:pilus assembly protein CpaF
MQEEILDEIRAQVVAELIEKTPWISEQEFENESRALRDISSGLGPFSQILENENFTDFFVNASTSAWINRGAGLEEIEFYYEERTLVNFIRSQALRVGKLFDQAHPAVDLELSSGVRLHALLPPLVESGVHVSIRINQKESVWRAAAFQREALDLIIKSRRNFLISGGTGSGKTTLFSQLIEQVPENQRLLIIEDTHEIQAKHPHVLRLQARESNSEGIGAISIRELIRHALRMKPDRIFLGEVRGGDVLDLFLALNTGHAGSGATIHGNSPNDIPNRIASLAMTIGMPREGALALFASSIDLIIHLDGDRTGNRISSISQVVLDGANVAIRNIVEVSHSFSMHDLAKLEKAFQK